MTSRVTAGEFLGRETTVMRASVLRGVHDLAVEERPVPEPDAAEVIVQVTAVGVCGSDIHYYEQGRIGRYVVDRPLVLGHEGGGVVVGVGTGVDPARLGRRVSIEPGVPCRQCARCLTGHYNLCRDVRFLATPPYDGAFCQYVAMPSAFVYDVPDSISDDAAGLLEPLSVGVWACRRAAVTVGSRVLVTGAGPIGLVTAQAARAFGASEVVITDVNAARLELAATFGATAVDVSSTPLPSIGFEPDVLLECSGHPAATAEAVRTVGKAGRVVLIGMGGDEITLPLSFLQDQELVITGAFRYANTWPTAITLAASGAVDLDRLVTGHYGLDEVERALTAPRTDPSTVKPMVVPQRRAG
jgi:L-iditol 2-dehydrogenase